MWPFKNKLSLRSPADITKNIQSRSDDQKKELINIILRSINSYDTHKHYVSIVNLLGENIYHPLNINEEVIEEINYILNKKGWRATFAGKHQIVVTPNYE